MTDPHEILGYVAACREMLIARVRRAADEIRNGASARALSGLEWALEIEDDLDLLHPEIRRTKS